MRFQRLFTTPYTPVADQIKWKTVSSEIMTSDHVRIFFMPEVEVPEHWSQGPTNILAQKYFRKAGVPTKTEALFHHQNIPKWLWNQIPTNNSEFGSEISAKQVFHRLAGAWTYHGWKEGIFGGEIIGHNDDGSSNKISAEQNAKIFYDEIYYMLANQFAAPNSPQWFNTGLNWAYGITGDKSGQWAIDSQGQPYETQDSYTNPQVHACYIQPISDNLVENGGIFDLLRKEAIIFKHGSGTGTNFSNLRSKYETLSGGGKSSGLMSFLKIYDTAAGAIQSGGTTRRAAKLICLDLDHPEIEEFIDHKMKEEAKAAALYMGSKLMVEDSGTLMSEWPESIRDRINNGIKAEIYDLGFEGIAMSTVDGQNANVSIRITDDFLLAVDNNDTWVLKARTTGIIIKRIKARDLWQKICTAAWACADPGLLFHDTINLWNTVKSNGTINSCNPCGEYQFLDDTACNLASLNLGKFFSPDHTFDIKSFTHATRLWTTVLEISVFMASFPSKEIALNSYLYRTLGLGYCNAGGVLMRQGIGYDSDKGRDYIASITALMHGVAYYTSADTATELGPFKRWEENRKSMLDVIELHQKAGINKTGEVWKEANSWLGGLTNRIDGFRNAQVTLIAPTGTIALLMDSGDFTGIEPGFSLVQYKQLAGGGGMKIVNNCVPEALKTLGYTPAQIMSISQHIEENDTIEGWTLNGQPMSEEHLAVFDCAVPGGETGTRSLRPEAHILMMAAAQPFLSGAISKSVNLPNNATIADVDHIYRESHRLGLKAVALYRDGSKLTQPLNSKQSTIKIYESFKKELLDGNVTLSGSDPTPEQLLNKTPDPILEQFIIDELLKERERKFINSPGVGLPLGILSKNTKSFTPHTPVIKNDKNRLPRAKRERLPPLTHGYTQKFSIDAQSIYLTTGEYDDGRLGQIFIEYSRGDSFARALMNSVGKLASIALQHGTPLKTMVNAFVFTKFEPSGLVIGHNQIKICTSPLDAVFKDLGIRYLNMTELGDIKPNGLDHEAKLFDNNIEKQFDQFEVALAPEPIAPDSIINQDIATVSGAGPINQDLVKSSSPHSLTTILLRHADACSSCGHYPTIRTGTCITCPNCGANSGCG